MGINELWDVLAVADRPFGSDDSPMDFAFRLTETKQREVMWGKLEENQLTVRLSISD